MDTKHLERFATQSRRELLAAVEAQASAALAAGSIARSERGETVKRLEAEIAKHGQKHVIDKVAYTWFNRLIALRYMDARGYTSAGIVSPAQGHGHGQPEILADAKRGHLATEVVTSARTVNEITGLLDGSRRSTDAEGEAYGLLLTEYCRHWNKAMPFMFELEGDYTELLVPSGLLGDGAILSIAREVLSEDVCEDVEVIGWLYQFYISERKDEVFAGFKKNKKAGADEIPAATQLFTPHWIVRYLVENSLGRLWMLNRPASGLVDQMDYYIAPIDEEADFLKVNGPEELTVIDPACGSGHMLTYAFDLLYAIYEEEGYAPSEIPSLIFTHNLHGTEIDPRAGSLAAFALTMKARAKDRRFFTKDVEPKICVIEPISFGPDELDFLVTKDGDRHVEEAFWNQFRDADTLGSLIKPNADEMKHAEMKLGAFNKEGDLLHGRTLAHARKVIEQGTILSSEYAIAVANPPYMGSKNMDARLVDFVRREYPDGKQDLYGCFVLRAMNLVSRGGMVAKVIGDTWMSIVSFKDLREDILAGHSFDSFVHLRDVSNHPDVFGANAAFVLAMTNSPGRQAPFVRLASLNEEDKRLRLIEAINNAECEWRFESSSEDFAKVPGSPIAYWLSDAMRAAFAKGRPLKEVAEPRKGLGPGDSPRFLRYWWEISGARADRDVKYETDSAALGARWFPFNKGGEFRKWWGNQEYVVNWKDRGHDVKQVSGARPQNIRFYFQPTVSWSKISSGEPAFRFYPEGWMFSDAGLGLYADYQEPNLLGLMGFLNSTVALELFSAVSPTLNYEAGAVGSLPALPEIVALAARDSVDALRLTSRDDWDSFETSWDFARVSMLSERVSDGALPQRYTSWSKHQVQISVAQQDRETENNRVVAEAYGLQSEVPIDVALHRVSLTRNVEFRYGPRKTAAEYEALERADIAAELISYAVGCLFGRYSLDEPGLILADQGVTLQDYLAKVPSPTFLPDADNVIPFVDDGWFEDDIVERFRQFLRAAFGAERFEENLRFVEESLGVKSIREYFISNSNPSSKSIAKSKFYDNHVQRYKKRPIYWMFSSPKGSFNALIYMHRYNPSTVSTVLNEYLREYRAKLAVALQRAEEGAAGGTSAKEQKEADRLRKVLAELRDYEHDVLYPLATEQVAIDLDDGVKVNYPKFYPALRTIKGLEAADG